MTPANQLADLGVNLRSAGFPGSGLSSPVELEALLASPDHRLGLHDEECASPIRPDAGQPNPENPVTFPKPWPFRALLQDRELLPQCKVFGRQLGVVSNCMSKQDKKNAEKAHFTGLQNCWYGANVPNKPRDGNDVSALLATSTE